MQLHRFQQLFYSFRLQDFDYNSKLNLLLRQLWQPVYF